MKNLSDPAKIPLLLSLLVLVLLPLSVLVASQTPRTQTRGLAGEGRVAIMFLEPSVVQAKVGEAFPLNVYLNTIGQEVEAADVVIKYDPEKLELVDNTVKPGLVLENYTGLTVDARKGFATIKASGGSYKGVRGKLAEVSFRPKAAGSTTVELYFQSGGLQECAVWSQASKADILKATNPAKIEIK
ncbi:MAG: cohesin domain-containing protein [bacterium]|nr:cohesin domain-containing protein [bacterium]